MSRNISFSLTTAQVRAEKKTVTRRMGWNFLKAGDVLNACVKCMGLKKGEKPEVICRIAVVSVRREPLTALLENIDYGFKETALEGFPHLHPYSWPSAFVEFFCASHKGCTPMTAVNRIEFKYLARTGVRHADVLLELANRGTGMNG
jgi:hypothetical protein